MQHLADHRLFYSATDLTNFLGCRHLTVLERLAAGKVIRRPFFDDPMLELLQERGLEHERSHVQHLANNGRRVVEIARHDSEALAATIKAMRDGADVIVQGRLEHGSWAGWVDVLLRVDGVSAFGSYHYEPVETKLAKETRGATLIQLCLYAELLSVLQGSPPEQLRVVIPETGFRPETYRFAEFRAYFAFVARNFERAIRAPLPGTLRTAESYPEPVHHCEICRWSPECERRWLEDDHLSLVADIRTLHRNELTSWGVTTLAALARLPIPLSRKPSRGNSAVFERLREQARLQLEARISGHPVYELLPVEVDQGLAALPTPSVFDLFLDLEGDRQAEKGGFDYLFGYAFIDASGEPRYETSWALSPEEEKSAFERFIDVVVERRQRDPAMHVYHYAAYEQTAMKRLMGKYATRAVELDDLLRGEVFVDLFRIVRKGLRAGVDSYSIKKLEPLYGFVREVDLRNASRQLRAVEYAIAKRDTTSLTREIRELVVAYNRDDCVSALKLRDWLEELRQREEDRTGAPLPRRVRSQPNVPEKLEARLARIRELSDALTAGLPVDRTREQEAQWILAQLLEWHRREDKVDWWEYHHLNDITEEDLLDELAGIAGLVFEHRIETTKRSVVVDRYHFPPQDTDLRSGADTYVPGSDKPERFAEVEALDLEHQTIDLRKGVARAELHPRALFTSDRIDNAAAQAALQQLGEFVRDHGIDAAGPHRAARDLLLRRNPRLATGHQLRLEGESTVTAARRVALQLNNSVLAVQGPPGAGKTFTGARMILDLVRAGRNVGVTAGSHKVIRNLLEEVLQAAKHEQLRVRCMQRVREKSKIPNEDIVEVTNRAKAVKTILAREFDVVGGTAWVWPKVELAGAIDVLVVDEAGQISLANVVACAQAASSVVLLGDPQQLEQPQKASHPEGSGVSALEYLLDGHDTMPEDRGLFLGETWRLHPAICAFTSELFYEGKLASHPSLEIQRITGPTPFAGAGLFFVPVAHEGNQNSSPEEAECVAEIVHNLLDSGVTWTSHTNETRPLTPDDVLIVAPYNAHVSEIGQRLPQARIGTVDKFQGQQAAIVIYSTATSSHEDAPHGMEFLFSRHRLNVATSRARSVCILVGNPQLFEPVCHTPDQMGMANAFCRYLELAQCVDWPAS